MERRDLKCDACQGTGRCVADFDEPEYRYIDCSRCAGAGVLSCPVLPGRCNDRVGRHHSMWYSDKGLVCSFCGIPDAHVPKIVIAGCRVQASSDFGIELQRQREDGGFHWRDDIYFKRLADGSVRVRRPTVHNHTPWFVDFAIPPNEWASIVCSVSAAGETRERWDTAQDFHGRVSSEGGGHE